MRKRTRKPVMLALAVATAVAATIWAGDAQASCGSCGTGGSKSAGGTHEGHGHGTGAHDGHEAHARDAHAHDGHGHDGAGHGSHAGSAEHPAVDLHGGYVHEIENVHFETVTGPDRIRVYLYTAAGVPMHVGKAEGTVQLTDADGKTVEVLLKAVEPVEGDETAYFCPGHPQATRMEPGICEACGTMQLLKQNHLEVRGDLSEFRGGTAALQIRSVRGLEEPVEFSVDLTAGPEASR